MKNKENDLQLSIFDMLNIPSDIDKTYHSWEINELIEELLEAKRNAKKREDEEKRIQKAKEREERLRKEHERQEQHIQTVTSMDLPLDWYNAFDKDVRTQNVHFESIPDALIHCLTTLGKVDIEFIASVTGTDYKTVIYSLRGSIFQNPLTWGECFYKGWETSDEYLSGNLMRKWNEAKEANDKYKGYFKENVIAIEKLIPPSVATQDIYVTLGSPWIPPDIIDDFIIHLFGDPLKHCYNLELKWKIIESGKTKHDSLTGTWEIPVKSRYNHSVAVSRTWGTDRMEALYILEKTLNMKTIVIHDEVSCPTNASGIKKVINKAETLSAIEKQQKMIQNFQKWVWKYADRKERLETIFATNYGCIKRRIFDGSFLEFPTMSKQINMYPYQKNAVARILFTPNTLLAHDVGAGKTYVMIAAGQELRRMGLSKKNMYVVPNNIVGQWKKIFLEMYPDAKLLCVEPKMFIPDKRENVLKRIRDKDFDAIIIAYSCFEQIPLSKAYYLETLKENKELIEQTVCQENKATFGLKRKKDKLSKALSELSLAMDDVYNTVYFDELGITRLFVDEAHNFKNVPIETNITKVLGINSTGSKKCRDMMDKVHMIQKNNEGKGVVMATATPEITPYL